MPNKNPNNATMIGVDVAKDKLDLYIYETNKHIEVANKQKSIRRFIRELKAEPGKAMFVMEHTGGYEKCVWELLEQAGHLVHVVHPLRASYFSRQKGYFAKTDKVDAKILASYGLQEQVEATPRPSDADLKRQALSSRRNQLVEQLTQEKLRMKEHLITEIKQSLKRMIKHTEKEISLVDSKIKQSIAEDETKQSQLKRLMTFKGVGEVTAMQLVCLLPELGLLCRKTAACLTGLAPKNKDSGTKEGKRMISGGRFYARKALYMAALSSIRHNVLMKAYYQKLKNKGKHSKVALVAVMRKMIITLNAMLRDGKDWIAV